MNTHPYIYMSPYVITKIIIIKNVKIYKDIPTKTSYLKIDSLIIKYVLRGV